MILSKLIKIFSSLDFVDDIHKDPLTGGDGHLDFIKAYLYDDYFSIELWSTFCIVYMTEFNQEKLSHFV